MSRPELPSAPPDFHDGFAAFPWPAFAQFHRRKNASTAKLLPAVSDQLNLDHHYPQLLAKQTGEIQEIVAHAQAAGYFLIANSGLDPQAPIYLKPSFLANTRVEGMCNTRWYLPEFVSRQEVERFGLEPYLKFLQIQHFDCSLNISAVVAWVNCEYQRASHIYTTNLRGGTSVVRSSKVADVQLKSGLLHARQKAEAAIVEEVAHAFYWSGNWPEIATHWPAFTRLNESARSLINNHSQPWDQEPYLKDPSEYTARIWTNEYLSRYYPDSPVTRRAHAELDVFVSYS